jgi:XRE family transcriptional regulator, master regulator for biofilm formation
MTATTLGRTLARLRARRGLSQLALSKRARVSQGYISSIEAGKSKRPGIGMLQRLAKALDVPVTRLLT